VSAVVGVSKALANNLYMVFWNCSGSCNNVHVAVVIAVKEEDETDGLVDTDDC
jgi:hypothetical protein